MAQSMTQELNPEFVSNRSQRAPVVLVLDTSGSMTGEKLQELNDGLQALHQELRNDDTAATSVDLALVTFGPEVQVALDFSTSLDLRLPPLEAAGQTPMGEALNRALNLIEARKEAYRQNGISYYRPWLMLITDGDPTDPAIWPDAAERLQAAESANHISAFVIGVEGANMKLLKDIAPKQRPPLMLKGLQFRELFLWLSASVKAVSHSQGGQDDIDLPPPGWARVGVN